MKIKQILLCMLLACFILPASAQNSWGIVGGGLFSKSLSRDARFRSEEHTSELQSQR